MFIANTIINNCENSEYQYCVKVPNNPAVFFDRVSYY